MLELLIDSFYLWFQLNLCLSYESIAVPVGKSSFLDSHVTARPTAIECFLGYHECGRPNARFARYSPPCKSNVSVCVCVFFVVVVVVVVGFNWNCDLKMKL